MTTARRQEIVEWLEEGHDSDCPAIDSEKFPENDPACACSCGREQAEEMLVAYDEQGRKLERVKAEARASLPSELGKWSEGANQDDVISLLRSCIEFLEDAAADREDERDTALSRLAKAERVIEAFKRIQLEDHPWAGWEDEGGIEIGKAIDAALAAYGKGEVGP